METWEISASFWATSRFLRRSGPQADFCVVLGHKSLNKKFRETFRARWQDDRWAAEVASMAAFAAHHNYRMSMFACMARAHEARRKSCVQDFLHAKFASRGAWHGMEWHGVRLCAL